jgi:hypothetical protein
MVAPGAGTSRPPQPDPRRTGILIGSSHRRSVQDIHGMEAVLLLKPRQRGTGARTHLIQGGTTMSRIAAVSGRRPVDDFFLIQPQPDGPVVGYLSGCPIHAAVIDLLGSRFIYVGIAPRCRNGRYDVNALRRDEWIMEPGLVYIREDGKP